MVWRRPIDALIWSVNAWELWTQVCDAETLLNRPNSVPYVQCIHPASATTWFRDSRIDAVDQWCLRKILRVRFYDQDGLCISENWTNFSCPSYEAEASDQHWLAMSLDLKPTKIMPELSATKRLDVPGSSGLEHNNIHKFNMGFHLRFWGPNLLVGTASFDWAGWQ